MVSRCHAIPTMVLSVAEIVKCRAMRGGHLLPEYNNIAEALLEHSQMRKVASRARRHRYAMAVQLMKIMPALGVARRLDSLAQSGDDHGCEDPDDRDHDQKFDERESGSAPATKTPEAMSQEYHRQSVVSQKRRDATMSFLFATTDASNREGNQESDGNPCEDPAHLRD